MESEGEPKGQPHKEITHWKDLPPKWQYELKMWIWEGFFAQFHLILVGGKYLTEFMMLLGAHDFHIGFITSLPFICQPFVILAPYLCHRMKSRSIITIISVILARGMWVFIIPLIFLKSALGMHAVYIFMTLYFLMSIGAAIAGNAWTLWMMDVVPEKMRGRFFGLKGAILSILTIVVDFISSQSRDYFLGIEKVDFFYYIFLPIAAIAAIVNIKIMKGRWEPHTDFPTLPSFLTSLNEFRKNRNFMVLSGAMILWNIGVGMASPFFSVHMLKILKMSFLYIWFYTFSALILGFVFNIIWGRIMDKLGNKPVILFNSFIITTIPLLWLFAQPDNYMPVYIDGVLTGICWTGFNLAMFNMPLSLAPKKEQTLLISTFLAISGFAFGAGSFLGGYIANHFQGFSWTVFGYVYVNYHILFVISALMRGLGAALFVYIKDTKSKGFFYSIQIMGEELQKRYFIIRDMIFVKKNGE